MFFLPSDWIIVGAWWYRITWSWYRKKQQPLIGVTEWLSWYRALDSRPQDPRFEPRLQSGAQFLLLLGISESKMLCLLAVGVCAQPPAILRLFSSIALVYHYNDASKNYQNRSTGFESMTMLRSNTQKCQFEKSTNKVFSSHSPYWRVACFKHTNDTNKLCLCVTSVFFLM